MTSSMTIDEILEGATIIIDCGKQIPALEEYARELEADLFFPRTTSSIEKCCLTLDRLETISPNW